MQCYQQTLPTKMTPLPVLPAIYRPHFPHADCMFWPPGGPAEHKKKHEPCMLAVHSSHTYTLLALLSPLSCSVQRPLSIHSDPCYPVPLLCRIRPASATRAPVHSKSALACAIILVCAPIRCRLCRHLSVTPLARAGGEQLTHKPPTLRLNPQDPLLR